MNRNSIFRMACCLFLALLGLGIVTGGTAFAQAEMIKATPEASSTVQDVPDVVTITTSENVKLDPAGTNIYVYGPHGKLISKGNARMGQTPRTLSVPVTNDGNGIYVVQWKTVSAVDGSTTQGAFTFTVAPEQNNIPILVVMATSIVTLVIGILIGVGLGRRRTALADQIVIDDERDAE